MRNDNKGILTLDPRTKIILLLGVNIFVFTNHYIYAEMVVISAIVLLLLFCGVYRTAFKSAFLYIALLIIQYYLLPLSPAFLLNSLNILVITCRKLLPCVTLGALLVQTTPIRILMHALQKWHIPQSMIIPLAITIRYFPTLREEEQAISDAMKLRNVRSPLKKIEYIFIPMMMSASSTADELSQAIIARGIDNPKPKTCSVELKFRFADIILCIISLVLILMVPIVN